MAIYLSWLWSTAFFQMSVIAGNLCLTAVNAEVVAALLILGI